MDQVAVEMVIKANSGSVSKVEPIDLSTNWTWVSEQKRVVKAIFKVVG